MSYSAKYSKQNRSTTFDFLVIFCSFYVYSLVLARYLTLNAEWAGTQCDNLQLTEIPQHIYDKDLRFIDVVSLIFLFCVCTNTGVPLCIHLLYCHLSVVTLIFQFSPVNNPLSKNLFCSICQIVNEHCHRCIFCLLLFSTRVE